MRIKPFFLIALIVFALGATFLTQDTAFATSLGVAQDYNAFIFEDFTAGGGAAQGRLAVGGDVSLEGSYDVGTGLAGDTSGTTNSLVAGGDLTTGWSKIYNGNAAVGGSVTTPDHYTSPSGSSFLENTTGIINWEAAETYFTGLSQDLKSLTTTGTAEVWWGSNFIVSGDSTSDLQVFNVDGNSLASVTTYKFENSINTAPVNATFVFNVSGTSVSMTGGMWDLMSDLGESYDNILFNFYEATALSIYNITFQGSILAPLADIDVNGGAINGTVIGKSFTSDRSGLTNVLFEGSLGSAAPSPVPEPGTLALFSIGLLVCLGIARKRRKHLPHPDNSF